MMDAAVQTAGEQETVQKKRKSLIFGQSLMEKVKKSPTQRLVQCR